MDIDDIQKRLDVIREFSSDCETAHAEEDRLMVDFIRHVAESKDIELSQMAQLVLTSNDITFSRWYA